MDALTRKKVHDTESAIVKAYFQQNAFDEFDGLLPVSMPDRVMSHTTQVQGHQHNHPASVQTPPRRGGLVKALRIYSVGGRSYGGRKNSECFHLHGYTDE